MSKKSIFTKLLFAVLMIFTSNCLGQKKGIQAIDSLKNDLKTLKKVDTNYIKISYRIASRFQNIDSDSAMRYATKGLGLSEKLHWKKGIAAFNDLIGSIYSDNGDILKALAYYQKSLAMDRAIKNLRNETVTTLNIGSAYQRLGKDVKALEYSFQALKLAEKGQYDDLIAILYGNISDSYFAQKDLNRALSYSVKSYKKYKQLGDEHGIAGGLDGIGCVFIEQENYSKAKPYFQESLEIYSKLGDRIKEAELLSHLAMVYENDRPQKISYLLSAQKIYDQTRPHFASSIRNLANIAGSYADLYVTKKFKVNRNDPTWPKNYDELAAMAEQYYKRGLEACKITGDQSNLAYLSEELSVFQESKGEYQDALKNFRLSVSVRDSLYSQESKNEIANLQAKYLIDKKEQEYKQKEELANLKLRQSYLYTALAVLLGAAILIVLLNRARIRQLRLKNELQQKQAEAHAKELIHRNKLSESELKAIRAQMNPHFIFNVLNSIESYIVENDARTASRLVQKFASLSRLILENSTQSLVPADREWKALRLYTELEAMRFNHQFQYFFTADELLNLSTVMVPPMLVQPLIENAIHHGMRNSTKTEKWMSIILKQTDDTLIFSVEDNGIGFDETEKVKTITNIKTKSIGLSSIRDRIESFNALHEGQMASFTIQRNEDQAGGGTLAVLILPKIIRN